MRNKKVELATPTPEELLEAKVDAMMDPSSDSKPKASTRADTQNPEAKEPATDLPPLDIFSNPSTAPEVPKDLLKELGGDNEDAMEQSKAAPVAATASTDVSTILDDPATDAAVDDIVAHESDEVLATEDDQLEEAAANTEPVEQISKLHHHPVFWTCIFLVALLAIVLGYLFATGGNSHLPGSGTIQNLINRIRNR